MSRLPSGDTLPTIETERLRLRWLTASDVPALFEVFSHPEVMRFWSSPALQEPREANELLGQIHAFFAAGTLYQWGLARKSDDGVIGTCTLASITPEHRRAEIGFALGRPHWGRGYATEAVSAVIGYAFDTLDLNRIEADVDPGNLASLRCLERLGFKREGYSPERYWVGGIAYDSVLLGLLRSGSRSETP